jgi:hypothetical protein
MAEGDPVKEVIFNEKKYAADLVARLKKNAKPFLELIDEAAQRGAAGALLRHRPRHARQARDHRSARRQAVLTPEE